MVTVVVTAVDVADPTLLTVTAMPPAELVLQVVGVIAMSRSGPFTICTVADAELSNEFTSSELDTDACRLTAEVVGVAAIVPLTTMAAKL